MDANVDKIEQGYGVEFSDGQATSISTFLDKASADRLVVTNVPILATNEVFETVLIMREGNSVTLFSEEGSELLEFVELPLIN